MAETDMQIHPDQERHFFIQAIDPPSGFAVSEVYCGLVSIEQMQKLLGIGPGDLDNRHINHLNKGQGCILKKFFFLEFDQGQNDAGLCSWSPHDGLPYRLHPNRELLLMLSRHKPLAMFSEIIATRGNFEKIPEYLFDPFVEKGLFIKTEYCEPNTTDTNFVRGLRIVLYALLGEAWRIDAYVMVRNTAKKIGWSEPLIRLEGRLLGYAEWQNDAYIASMQARGVSNS